MYPDSFYTYYRMSTEQFDYSQYVNLQYASGTYSCYHLKALSMFTLLHLLSPTRKQYCVEMTVSKILSDVFV